MRCSPLVRPAPLKHPWWLRDHPAPFRPWERSPRRPPYSTARWPIQQPGGRFDRMAWADSTARRPIRPYAVRRLGRPRAGPAGRGLPICPLPVAATGGNCRLGRVRDRSERPVAACGDGRCDSPPPPTGHRSAANSTENPAFTTRHIDATAVDSGPPRCAQRSQR